MPITISKRCSWTFIIHAVQFINDSVKRGTGRNFKLLFFKVNEWHDHLLIIYIHTPVIWQVPVFGRRLGDGGTSRETGQKNQDRKIHTFNPRGLINIYVLRVTYYFRIENI